MSDSSSFSMVILLAVSGIALSVGLFFLMADVLKIPYDISTDISPNMGM